MRQKFAECSTPSRAPLSRGQGRTFDQALPPFWPWRCEGRAARTTAASRPQAGRLASAPRPKPQTRTRRLVRCSHERGRVRSLVAGPTVAIHPGRVKHGAPFMCVTSMGTSHATAMMHAWFRGRPLHGRSLAGDKACCCPRSTPADVRARALASAAQMAPGAVSGATIDRTESV
jgi:hypothetical protein